MKKRSRGYINDRTMVKKSEKGGLGLFCVTKIKKGEIILIWQGWILTKKELLKLGRQYVEDAIQLNSNFFVGCLDKFDFELNDYLNHSCEPNAGFQGDITLVAMRDILKGEEITMDYAMVDDNSLVKMKCDCGEINCRKIISGKDWKIVKLQKKYNGYFTPYISSKINV